MSNIVGAMRSISFRSVLKIPEFNSLVEFDILAPAYDDKVSPYLFALGVDTNREVGIDASKHRDLDGKVGIGYRYFGYERTDQQWLKSGYASIQARIEANNDSDLKADLYDRAAEGIGAKGWISMCSKAADNTDKATRRKSYYTRDDEVEEDYEECLAMIETLTRVQEDVRGYVKVSDAFEK